MIATYNEFPLILLRDSVYNHLQIEVPVLNNIKLNGEFRIGSNENKYTKDYCVNLCSTEYRSSALFNPIRYILKVKIDSNNRLYYEVFDQEKMKEKGYSVLTADEFEEYKQECIRIVNEVNGLLDKIEDDNFPTNWKEYKSL